jgi:hypothetical protein
MDVMHTILVVHPSYISSQTTRMVYITSILYIVTNHQNGIHNIHTIYPHKPPEWYTFWWFVTIYRMYVMYTILVVCEDI